MPHSVGRFVTLSEGSAILDLDGTFFIQLALFLTAFLVLRPFVFKPIMTLFEAREQAIDGARADAKRMDREAKDKGIVFDEEMRKLRLAAGEERDRLRAEGLRLEKAVLEKVQKDTQGMLADAERTIARERARIQSDMSARIPALATQIASKLLGREVQR